jgi:hypothetical protein
MTSHRIAAAWVVAVGGGEIHYAPRRRGVAPGRVKAFDGQTMDDQDRATEKTAADVKDSRRDRLKLALRENLKRRKSQARGRSDAASSENEDASLDTAGEKP